MNIGIIFGGNSYEHDISIISAKVISKGIKNPYFIYLNKENKMFYLTKISPETFFDEAEKAKECVFIKGGIKVGLRRIYLDSLISTCHGQNGEDGLIASLSEFYNIPYCGNRAIEAGICLDKYYTYNILKSNGIPTIKTYLETNFKISSDTSYILKPAHLGSSIGIFITDDTKYSQDLLKAKEYDDKVVIQPYLTDIIEYNQACYKKGDELIFSKIEEVSHKDQILSFENKYYEKRMKSFSDDIETKLKEKIRSTTEKIYKLFSFSSVVRIDYIYYDKKLYVNEINTTPGSLAYYLFDSSIEKYMNDLLREAIKDFKKRKSLDFCSDVLNKKYSYKK